MNPFADHSTQQARARSQESPRIVPEYSPAEWDVQYNNRARVPGFEQHLQNWRVASEKARQQACVLDLAYGNELGERLDVFLPKGSDSQQKLTAAPVMLFIHGGYWRSLDKSDHSFIAPAFTQQGVCVVILNYDLCPQVSVTHIVEQMKRAVAWVHDHIAAYGGDPSRMAVAGHSAGGHLTAVLMATDWPQWRSDLPSDLVKKGLSLSGLFDLEPIRRTPFLQTSLHLSEAEVQACSPLCGPAPVTKGQLCAWVGGDESEEFLRQNHLIAAHWGHELVPICAELEGLNHFSILEAWADECHKLQNFACDWLFRVQN